MPTKSRKHYTAGEKISILRKHLVEKIPVSDLCEQFKLQPTQFYRWQKQFFEQGEIVFTQPKKGKADKADDKVAALEEKLQRKNDGEL